MSTTVNNETVFDVAELAHIEILSPKPDETVKFFLHFLGLEETAREGQSVYLRANEDLYHYSLKITEHKEAGLGHISWRASSPQSLQRRAVAIQATGLGRGWTEGDYGHGKSYQFTTPDGHMMELLWEIEARQCRDEEQNRGVSVKRLDHVHIMDTDPGKTTHFMQTALGFRLKEQMVDHGIIIESAMSASDVSKDISVMKERTGRKGKLHHLTYCCHAPHHLYELAALLKENEVFIEAEPNKHGMNQTFSMYVYEPGGNRIELLGDTSSLIYDPALQPIIWDQSELTNSRKDFITSSLPESFWKYGTPATLSHPR